MNKTIAVDIDDVLSASAEGFAKFSDERWGGTHSPADYLEAWAVFWKIPLAEAIKRADEFHTTDAVRRYRHFKDAVDVLTILKKNYRLIILTSRRAVLKTHTDAWLEEYFPGLFEEIHYAGIWDTKEDIDQQLDRTKAELCRQLGAQYLIDDQPKHCIGAAEAGLTALLFGDYKWQEDVSLPKGVVRTKDWRAVGKYFDDAKG